MIKRPHFKQTSLNLGRATFKAYADMRNLPAIERKEHYTATDVITDVLTFAKSKGWDVDTILASVKNHLWAETPVSCAKCGNRTTHEWAIADPGTGPEAGNTFYYCSDACKEKH
jgi:hypothetical protein